MNKFEVGKLAEGIALDHERSRLGIGRDSSLVQDVSKNTNLGYDIESVDSVDSSPNPRFIEVKAIGRNKNFIISNKELKVLKSLGDMAFIYLVNTTKGIVERIIQNPLKSMDNYEVNVYSYKIKL